MFYGKIIIQAEKHCIQEKSSLKFVKERPPILNIGELLAMITTERKRKKDKCRWLKLINSDYSNKTVNRNYRIEEVHIATFQQQERK